VSRVSNAEGYEYAEPVVCVGESTAALKLRVSGTGRTFWVPKSVVHDDSEVYKDGSSGKLVVQEWFAEKEGWA